MPSSRKLVIVTRKTQLDELVERFNSRDQARFYIEHMGGDFAPYQDAHDAYKSAIAVLRSQIPAGQKTQWIDRTFLPTFTFAGDDVVVVLGQDGLVVNTAKYLDGQPLIALNPDPARIDGVLLPFLVGHAGLAFSLAFSGTPCWDEVTLAEATLNDGQTMLAVNDLFIGQKTHVSAQYRLQYGDVEEEQSSSGIIVSTGAGSTGWLRSVVTGAAGIVESRNGHRGGSNRDSRFNWEARWLEFAVREPFVSKTSSAGIVHGPITPDLPLIVESRMPQNGVIFSDGVEADYLEFNSGSVATVGIAGRTLRLVQPGSARKAERLGLARWRNRVSETKSASEPTL